MTLRADFFSSLFFLVRPIIRVLGVARCSVSAACSSCAVKVDLYYTSSERQADSDSFYPNYIETLRKTNSRQEMCKLLWFIRPSNISCKLPKDFTKEYLTEYC